MSAPPWWREAVFYQIYLRSFLDSDGDGVGDLPGVTRQLDYLCELGVDALWICPFYPSPMRDFGYDVTDYCGIDATFGSLADFDDLVAGAHARGLRLIIDWVPNHTSSDHPWFVESRAGRSSPRREWYVWRDPGPGGGPPNNWLRSWSDASAWTWDESSGQYYLHCFLPTQPDLNWANASVRSAMLDTLRFWLDRGVDGFRMDVVHLLGKDAALGDDPVDLRPIGHVPLNDVPVTHEYLREIRAVLDGRGTVVSVGEVYLLEPERVAEYYGSGDELHLAFNFSSLLTSWRADRWAELIVRTERAHESRGAWPTWVLSNHDNQRIATRLRGDPQRLRSAAILLATLRGTPFVYAGEELGLPDAMVPPEHATDPGRRDGCRAPIPWTVAAGHGWPSEPWLPFPSGADQLAVDAQGADRGSMLNFWRSLLALRHSVSGLRGGECTDVVATNDVLTYARIDHGTRVQVCINFSHDARTCAVPHGARVLLSGSGTATVSDGAVTLVGGEGVVLLCAHQDRSAAER